MLIHAIGPKKDDAPKEQMVGSLCGSAQVGDYVARPNEPGRVNCPDCLNKMAVNRKR